MKTLNDFIIEAKSDGPNMPDYTSYDLAKMLTERCRYKTFEKMWRILGRTSLLSTCGLFDRVHYHEDTMTWSYCAGQPYPDEIREIRKILLNK